jgi:hypothetical protein
MVEWSLGYPLVQIDPVVLEELIKMQKGNDRRTTDAQW